MTSKIAVVGSGPSGMYAADALLQQGLDVDVFDKLPVPFGLSGTELPRPRQHPFGARHARSGLGQARIRFFGNVEVGRDISVEELRSGYEAVILTYGASSIGIWGSRAKTRRKCRGDRFRRLVHGLPRLFGPRL